MKNEFHLAEYQEMRREITTRVTLLHSLIALGTILGFATVFVVVWLLASDHHNEAIWLALVAPFLLAGITFNYQSNQMTMEAVARYIQSKYSKEVAWDDYYGDAKVPHRLTSFLKVTPLWVPLLLPLWLLFSPTAALSDVQQIVAGLGVFLLVLTIYNFRYKF